MSAAHHVDCVPANRWIQLRNSCRPMRRVGTGEKAHSGGRGGDGGGGLIGETATEKDA